MKLLKVVGGFLSFLLSIVFFGVLFFFITTLFSKNLLKEETLNTYIKEVDILELKADDIIGEEDKKLKEVLEEELKKYGVSDNLFNEIVEQQKTEQLMANFIMKYSNYILKDELKPVLLESDIYNILNSEMIESYSNRILTRKEKQDYSAFVMDVVSTINNNLPDKEEVLVKENVPYLNKILDFIYADNFNTIMIALLVGIFLIIALLTWSLYKPFGFIGVATTILGGILVLSYLAQKVGINYLITSDGTIENFTKNFINITFNYVLIYGGIVLISGIVMLVVHSIISKIINKKAFEKELEEKPKKRRIKKIETEEL